MDMHMNMHTKTNTRFAPLRALLPCAALFIAMLAATPAAHADVVAVAPTVDTASLPTIEAGWAPVNPLRGNANAVNVGREAFNQSCAACHGTNANGSRSPAPDLRRMGRSCQRLQDPALRQRCQSDADYFFVKSVRYGKQKFGIVHMPPWEGVLDPRMIWSIRTFVENAPMQ